jgi:hypothetical protein
MPSASIAHETGFDRKQVLRALTIAREAMAQSAPAHAGGRPDADPALPKDETERHIEGGKSTTPLKPKFVALGLFAAGESVWAEVLPDEETEQFRNLLQGRKDQKPIAWPGPGSYTAVAYRGRLYRVADPAVTPVAAPFGQIEAFWAYLHRQLTAKGGIRRERLDLYVAEYAWRYNRRKLSQAEQVRQLLELIRHHPRSWKKRDLRRTAASPGDAVYRASPQEC